MQQSVKELKWPYCVRNKEAFVLEEGKLRRSKWLNDGRGSEPVYPQLPFHKKRQM